MDKINFPKIETLLALQPIAGVSSWEDIAVLGGYNIGQISKIIFRKHSLSWSSSFGREPNVEEVSRGIRKNQDIRDCQIALSKLDKPGSNKPYLVSLRAQRYLKLDKLVYVGGRCSFASDKTKLKSPYVLSRSEYLFLLDILTKDRQDKFLSIWLQNTSDQTFNGDLFINDLLTGNIEFHRH